MKRITDSLAVLLVGATFWAPTVGMLVTSRWFFNVFVLTIVTVAFSATVFIPFLYSRHRLAGPVTSSLLLLGGIWLSGPALIVLGLRLGSSPRPAPSVPSLPLAELVSPMLLVVAATYAGTLGALCLVSLWLGATALLHLVLLAFRRMRRAV